MKSNRASILSEPPSNDHLTATRWDELPTEILQRLAREGVQSAAEWLALSHRHRRNIFGVTKAMQRALTSIAKVAP